MPVNAAGIPVVPAPTTATSADVISEEEGLVCVAEVRNEKVALLSFRLILNESPAFVHWPDD